MRIDSVQGNPCPYEPIIYQEGHRQACEVYGDHRKAAGIAETNKDRGKGRTVEDCPLHLKICYPSCYFWRGRCAYYEIISDKSGKNSE